ncbi:MAG: SagB/ThcOx family dehydrogenase [Planctomycetes bacterium]|nr:SagB/ThcOx family dehydrogenase [Planctomycetota bacterium]
MKEIKLPAPVKKGKLSLEETLSLRRSVRTFKDEALTDTQIGQILWAADGLSAPVETRANRTAPSAGAIYPVELYAVTKDGIYKYNLVSHSLKLIEAGDNREELSKACLGQGCVKSAPLSIIISGDYKKCSGKYRDRAQRYVDIEAGHIAQNIHLQAVALELGSVPVGAFQDDQVKALLNLPDNEYPVYIIPVGHPKK